jgi:vesicle-associated membrane protein 7
MHKQTHNQVLERGERLELLVERTEDLAQQTFLFKTDARGLRKRMWWARARVATCVVALLAAAAYGLAAAICGPALHC